MAKTISTDKVRIPVWGHGLESQGNIAHEPHAVGTFAADPVTGNDGKEDGVFTVAEGDGNPSNWVGVYRIYLAMIEAVLPGMVTEAATPDPDPDPDPQDPDPSDP